MRITIATLLALMIWATPVTGEITWVDVSAQDIKQHYRALVRISNAQGTQVEGMLVDVLGKRMRIQQAASDGGRLLSIRLSEDSHIQVLKIR